MIPTQNRHTALKPPEEGPEDGVGLFWLPTYLTAQNRAPIGFKTHYRAIPTMVAGSDALTTCGEPLSTSGAMAGSHAQCVRKNFGWLWFAMAGSALRSTCTASRRKSGELLRASRSLSFWRGTEQWREASLYRDLLTDMHASHGLKLRVCRISSRGQALAGSTAFSCPRRSRQANRLNR